MKYIRRLQEVKWGSVDGDQIFSPFFVGGLLTGDSDRYK